jgi:hypothetical protein
MFIKALGRGFSISVSALPTALTTRSTAITIAASSMSPRMRESIIFMAPFHSSRLKIERASKHINDLHNRILAFAANDSYALRVRHDGKIGSDVLETEVAKSLPEDFAPILGDALHNLKSALDVAINQILFLKLGAFDDYGRFPIRKSRDELANAVKGGKISQASKAVADFIVDVVKPYQGGNDALWALHTLNILDKHRILLPMMQITAVHDIRAEDETGELILIGTWVITRNRIATHECLRSRNVKITNHGHPTLLVLFEKGLPMEGEAVVPALIQLTESVSGVLEEIETVFLGENVAPS